MFVGLKVVHDYNFFLNFKQCSMIIKIFMNYTLMNFKKCFPNNKMYRNFRKCSSIQTLLKDFKKYHVLDLKLVTNFKKLPNF